MFQRISVLFGKTFRKKNLGDYLRFRSTIYGRVVFIIGLSFIIILILFNLVFRSVYTDFFNTTIRQNGDHISSIVEGALYHSMLENDKGMLQKTLDIISTMSGIDEVNMYNDKDILAYIPTSKEFENRGNPNCVDCHGNLKSLFSDSKKSYRIVESHEGCGIYQKDDKQRHLLIRTIIQNEKSCYTSACHAHKKEDLILGSMIINLPLEDIDTFVSESSINFLMLGSLITLILVSFLILFTRKKIKDPLNSIIKASEAVSSGNISIRLDIRPDLLDDMSKVSHAFNNMLDHIDSATQELQNWSQQLEYKVQRKTEELSEAQNELIHVERIASLGKLSSSVAHEINNPLSGILIYSKLIHKQLDNPDFHHKKKESILKQLRLIESETKRCGDIVKGLLDFSKKDQDDFDISDLHEILKATSNLMTHSIKIANISFKTEFKADSSDIYCSANQVKQACVALLVNATEAIQDNGEIIVRTSNPDKKSIKLEIIDNGLGISSQDLNHIFEPFFSTKRESSGIGLGLSIVYGIVENHKASISVESELGKGTCISILFPLKRNKL